MRFSRVVRASGFQCHSRNSSGSDPSILRHSRIGGAADDAVLNNKHTVKRKKNKDQWIGSSENLHFSFLSVISSLLNFHKKIKFNTQNFIRNQSLYVHYPNRPTIFASLRTCACTVE